MVDILYMAAFQNGCNDAELERQAQAMAESAMGSLGAVPSEKFIAVKQQILQRLRKQREASALKASAMPSPPPPNAPPPPPDAPQQPAAPSNGISNAVPPPPPPNAQITVIVSGSAAAGLNGKYLQQSQMHNGRHCFRHDEDPFIMFFSANRGKWYISTTIEETGFSFIESDDMMPPEGVWSRGSTISVQDISRPPACHSTTADGVELYGDELWFADSVVRQRLSASVAEGHKEQKIIVGQPAAEVARICPPDGRIVMAGAVLRLGGAHLGGYGDSDIAYAYRQLSRALHPDKNPDIPSASSAFMRLSTASDELRQALNDQRAVLQTLVGAMGGDVTPLMLDRPQEALFAEACRMLTAICGLTGEGWVPRQAQNRASIGLSQSNVFHRCIPDALITEWFSGKLLENFGAFPVRTAYDCAPKRFRAQFLCLLNRVLLAEATRSSGCVRAVWGSVLETFPELGVWRDFRDRIQQRVWDTSLDDAPKPSKWDRKDRSRSRSRSRDSSPDPQRAIAGHPESGEQAGKWALKWRKALAVVLPSGLDGGVSPLDPDLKKLAIAMWKDIVAWAGDGERSLGLFRSDAHMPQRGLPPDAPPAEWCFIPLSDMLLTVGSGLVGITAEGVFAANRSGHERKSLAKCYKRPATIAD